MNKSSRVLLLISTLLITILLGYYGARYFTSSQQTLDPLPSPTPPVVSPSPSPTNGEGFAIKPDQLTPITISGKIFFALTTDNNSTEETYFPIFIAESGKKYSIAGVGEVIKPIIDLEDNTRLEIQGSLVNGTDSVNPYIHIDSFQLITD
jgi:hypothetical protein